MIDVTQSARDAAADVWHDYVAKIGECIVENSIRKGGMDESNLVQAFAAAEQRGMIAARAWQPIATAPRDGSPFLACIEVRKNDRPIQSEIHIIGYDAAYDEMNTDYETGWDLEDYTHWQPLPAPPAIATMPMTAAPMHEISLPPEMKGMVIGGEDA